MSMHQFVPKFANKAKCNDCHEYATEHELTAVQLAKLKECGGVHANINDLFKCDSCALLFN